jgi:hypothetical protein
MQDEHLKAIKQALFSRCSIFIEDRIDSAQKAIKSAQESANQDSKSSMGDKYETGRAMAQLEIEKNTIQLAEAIKLKKQLETIPKEQYGSTIKNGSLILTNNGNYFLAISAGKIDIDGIGYFALSSISPLGATMMNLEEGNSFTFNGKAFVLKTVI